MNFESEHTKKTAAPNEAGAGYANPLDWMGKNIVNPVWNSLCAEPASAIVNAVNFASQKAINKDILAKVELAEVGQEEPGSVGSYVQQIAAGLSCVLPYAKAGKLAGFATRGLSRAAKMEKWCTVGSKIAGSEKTAQILGGALYDGLKNTRGEETHFSNAMGGAASFTAYEFLNPRLKGIAKLGLGQGKLGAVARMGAHGAGLFGVGAAGSIAHEEVSNFTRTGQFVDLKTAAENSVQGGVMNILLPTTQHALGKAIDRVNQKVGRGTPMDRMRQELPENVQESPTVKQFIAENPLARVQRVDGKDCWVDHEKHIVYYGKEAPVSEFIHELSHLMSERDPQQKELYKSVDALDKQGKTAEADAAYISARAASEIRAREIGEQVARECGLPEIDRGTLTVEQVLAEKLPDGSTYQDHWLKERRNALNKHDKSAAKVDYSCMTVDSTVERPMTFQDKVDDILSRQLKHNHTEARQEGYFTLLGLIESKYTAAKTASVGDKTAAANARLHETLVDLIRDSEFGTDYSVISDSFCKKIASDGPGHAIYDVLNNKLDGEFKRKYFERLILATDGKLDQFLPTTVGDRTAHSPAAEIITKAVTEEFLQRLPIESRTEIMANLLVNAVRAERWIEGSSDRRRKEGYDSDAQKHLLELLSVSKIAEQRRADHLEGKLKNEIDAVFDATRGQKVMQSLLNDLPVELNKKEVQSLVEIIKGDSPAEASDLESRLGDKRSLRISTEVLASLLEQVPAEGLASIRKKLSDVTQAEHQEKIRTTLEKIMPSMDETALSQKELFSLLNRRVNSKGKKSENFLGNLDQILEAVTPERLELLLPQHRQILLKDLASLSESDIAELRWRREDRVIKRPVEYVVDTVVNAALEKLRFYADRAKTPATNQSKAEAEQARADQKADIERHIEFALDYIGDLRTKAAKNAGLSEKHALDAQFRMLNYLCRHDILHLAELDGKKGGKKDSKKDGERLKSLINSISHDRFQELTRDEQTKMIVNTIKRADSRSESALLEKTVHEMISKAEPSIIADVAKAAPEIVNLIDKTMTSQFDKTMADGGLSERGRSNVFSRIGNIVSKSIQRPFSSDKQIESLFKDFTPSERRRLEAMLAARKQSLSVESLFEQFNHLAKALRDELIEAQQEPANRKEENNYPKGVFIKPKSDPELYGRHVESIKILCYGDSTVGNALAHLFRKSTRLTVEIQVLDKNGQLPNGESLAGTKWLILEPDSTANEAQRNALDQLRMAEFRERRQAVGSITHKRLENAIKSIREFGEGPNFLDLHLAEAQGPKQLSKKLRAMLQQDGVSGPEKVSCTIMDTEEVGRLRDVLSPQDANLVSQRRVQLLAFLKDQYRSDKEMKIEDVVHLLGYAKQVTFGKMLKEAGWLRENLQQKFDQKDMSKFLFVTDIDNGGSTHLATYLFKLANGKHLQDSQFVSKNAAIKAVENAKKAGTEEPVIVYVDDYTYSGSQVCHRQKDHLSGIGSRTAAAVFGAFTHGAERVSDYFEGVIKAKDRELGLQTQREFVFGHKFSTLNNIVERYGRIKRTLSQSDLPETSLERDRANYFARAMRMLGDAEFRQKKVTGNESKAVTHLVLPHFVANNGAELFNDLYADYFGYARASSARIYPKPFVDRNAPKFRKANALVSDLSLKPEVVEKSPKSESREKSQQKPIEKGTEIKRVSDDLYRKGDIELPDDMDEIQELKIQTIIDLKMRKVGKRGGKDKRQLKEIEAANAVGIKYEHVPIDGDNPSSEDIGKAVSAYDKADKPVLVHCTHGRDRTGAVVAALRIKYENWSLEQALKEMDEAGSHDEAKLAVRKWCAKHYPENQHQVLSQPEAKLEPELDEGSRMVADIIAGRKQMKAKTSRKQALPQSESLLPKLKIVEMDESLPIASTDTPAEVPAAIRKEAGPSEGIVEPLTPAEISERRNWKRQIETSEGISYIPGISIQRLTESDLSHNKDWLERGDKIYVFRRELGLKATLSKSTLTRYTFYKSILDELSENLKNGIMEIPGSTEVTLRNIAKVVG